MQVTLHRMIFKQSFTVYNVLFVKKLAELKMGVGCEGLEISWHFGH